MMPVRLDYFCQQRVLILAIGNACLALAARLQVLRLYPYRTDAAAFCQRLGGLRRERIMQGPLQIRVMNIEAAATVGLAKALKQAIMRP